MSMYITVLLLLAGAGWCMLTTCKSNNYRMIGLLLIIVGVTSINNTVIKENKARLTAIEQRIEACDKMVTWESSEPLVGGKLLKSIEDSE